MERSVVVRLKASIAEFKRDMSDAKSATEGVGKAGEDAGKKGSKGFGDLLTWANKNEQQLNTLTTQVGLFGVGLTAMAGLAVKSFADFDAAMSSVQAATMESSANMALLRDAAIEAGAATQYSAVEAAGAIENLAKAGVSTADILAGGLSGALSLAAADGIAVADAAEIASAAMVQFGLKGSDVAHIADLLAAGAGKAQGGVLDLGMALNQSGLVAAQMGLTLDETVGALTTFAEAGLVGSDAGTSFRAMLLRLANPTKESAELMKQLGLNMYDAQGEFVGVEALAGQLQDRLGGLTQEQRNAALATIFGQDAIRTSAILYENGAEGVREWTNAVNDQGYAAEQARLRTDNLRGDIERLGGSLDTALIQSGSGANDVLRELAQGAEVLVDRVGRLPESFLSATTLLVGAGGLASLGIAGLGKLTVAVAETRAAMQALNISTKAAGVAAGTIGGALAIGTFLLAEWAAAAAESKQNTDDFASTLDEATGAVTANTEAMAAEKVSQSEAARIYKNLGGNVSDLTGYVLGNADAIERVNRLLDEQPKEKFLWSESDAAGVAQVRSDLSGLSGDLENSAEKWDLQQAAMSEVAGGAGANATALQTYTAAVQDGSVTVEQYTSALEELISAQATAAGVVMDLWTAQNRLEAAYDSAAESLTSNGTTLDVTTEKGRANREALIGISAAGWDLIESMRANGATQAELQGQITATRDRFVAAAGAFGMSADEANALADQLNLIPSAVDVQVTANTATAISNLDKLKRTLDSIPGFKQVGVGTVLAPGFATGGYTGDVGVAEPAGVVHGREFVFDAPTTAKHRATFEHIHRTGQLPRGYRQGGYVEGLAALAGQQLRGYDKGGYVVPSAAVPVPTTVTSVAGASQPSVRADVVMPQSLVVLDADGALIGSMRVAARSEVAGAVGAFKDAVLVQGRSGRYGR